MKITVREALRNAMTEEMLKNDKIFVIGEEVAEYNGAYKVTQGMFDKFGSKRVIDTPITEHGFAGLAVGAALNGLTPIVEFMTFNFAMQAIDQIINSAAKTLYMSDGTVKCGIIFRGPNGSAKSVAAQHSQCYASWYAHCPGLIVIAPYDAQSAKGLLKSAINANVPVVFLEHELMYGESFEVDENLLGDDVYLSIGKAEILKEGSDITIVSFSYPLKACLEAVKILQDEHNIQCELIDLRTIRPLDIDTIVESVKKTNNILTVEEGWGFSGIGSEIITQITERCFDYLDSEPERITATDNPLPYASNLENLSLPNVSKIVDKILSKLKK